MKYSEGRHCSGFFFIWGARKDPTPRDTQHSTFGVSSDGLGQQSTAVTRAARNTDPLRLLGGALLVAFYDFSLL